MKARPFWNGPALPVLFLVSSLATGVAVQYLLIHALANGSGVAIAEGLLALVNIILVILELIILFIYIFIMRASAIPAAARTADNWLKGNKKAALWGGLVGIGLVIPLALYAVNTEIALLLASAGVLVGGIVLRFLIVYSQERRLLPGEAEFLAKLPSGNEEFLHAWEEPDHKAG
jgi:polysulfide reductase chain C